MRPVIKVANQGANSFTRLNCKTQVIYQPLERLFAFGCQAQIILHLQPHMLRSIIFHQVNSFSLQKLALPNIHPYVHQPWAKYKASIGGITSFNFATLDSCSFLNSTAAACRLWFRPSHKRSCGCGVRCINGSSTKYGAYEVPIWEVHSTLEDVGFSNRIGDVTMLANQTHLLGVVGVSASARISSKVSLVTIGGLSISGAWLVLEATPLVTFTVFNR